MSEAMLRYVKRMKERCSDWNTDCRLRDDVEKCEKDRKVDCPVVDHR